MDVKESGYGAESWIRSGLQWRIVFDKVKNLYLLKGVEKLGHLTEY
jgi:hypothetical protein